YRHGGMEFDDIGEFDKWLAGKENFERIFAHPRSMVAFQVRRNNKERYASSFAEAFINVKLGELDKLTFLYIRNGDRMYRLGCDLDFDGLIFPSQNELNLTEPMMCNTRHGEYDKLIPVREYEDRILERAKEEKNYEEWKKANQKK